jgi:hypothetical protein
VTSLHRYPDDAVDPDPPVEPRRAEPADDTFDERWAQWLAHGVARERRHRRIFVMVGCVVVVVLVIWAIVD